MGKIKIGWKSSDGSKLGMRVIIDILKRDAEFLQITDDAFMEDKVEDDIDLYIFHNISEVPERLRDRSIIFALQSVVDKIKKDPRLASAYKSRPPLCFWCNTANAAKELRGLNLPGKIMYRPGRLTIPKEYTPIPKEKRILWYWKSSHPQMKEYNEITLSVMSKIRGAEILTFPDSDIPLRQQNVIPIGRVNMSDIVPRVRGMVRITRPLDFGRSTFDVLVHGRWVLYNRSIPEIETSCAPDPEDFPDRIAELLERETDYECFNRFRRMSATFSPTSMRQAWQYALREMLDQARDRAGAVHETTLRTRTG